MSGFDYVRARARLDDYATATWPAERLRVIVDEHERQTPFRAMGQKLRASKNACISQAHRMGLPNRNVGQVATESNKRRAKAKRAAAPRPVRPAPQPPKPTALDQRHLRRAEVKAALALPALHVGLISGLTSSQCRWPVGDPRAADFGFCARPAPGAGPYCACHQSASVDRAATSQSHRGGIDRLANLALPRRPRGNSSLTGAWA